MICASASVNRSWSAAPGSACPSMSQSIANRMGLDNAGDARRHPVLKVELIFQRTVKAVGPQMRPTECIDQLRGDAHATACFAHRAFEDIAIDIDFADELVVLLSTAVERSANFRLRARLDETEYHVQ
jgi:hypothetical protein